jgi:hypothetical protein
LFFAVITAKTFGIFIILVHTIITPPAPSYQKGEPFEPGGDGVWLYFKVNEMLATNVVSPVKTGVQIL